ncbi:MAG: phenylalanine--tRNA ligase subunit alpha [bacterium]|nr:phenylalanine--tRNA ligase subunit alpha [bacterium]
MANLEQLKKQALEAVKQSKDIKNLEELRVRFLGREKGELTKILRSLGAMPLEEKKKVGPAANALRAELEQALDKKSAELRVNSLKFEVGLDITMPGTKVGVGHLHLLTQVEKQVREIFKAMNFSVITGPEAETEKYNFDALNIPKDHPARDMWDTFWLRQNEQLTINKKLLTESKKLKVKSEKLLMRTHTSPMQVRFMEKHKPPFQIIVPGRVFRFEATDASHEINFYQVEGLMVGRDVNLANFKFVMNEFFQRLFGKGIKLRYRPSYFPFVEPGLEIDIEWKGKWLEIMGAGMVHPRVFEAAHYNPRDLQGFAFGLGLERIAMIKYNIPDIRLFYSGDLRFIKQF